MTVFVVVSGNQGLRKRGKRRVNLLLVADAENFDFSLQQIFDRHDHPLKASDLFGKQP